MKEFFRVSVSKYDASKNYDVVRPASLNYPKDNSVMFITEGYINQWEKLTTVNDCVVIWPKNIEVPEEVAKRHVVIRFDDPRRGQALFYRDNNVTYNAEPCEYEIINGAYIAKGAKIGHNTTIFPGAYIDKDVVIGDNCYIASGVKIVGSVKIGNDVIIRENTVIGSDGLTRMRDDEGKVATIPQFGGVTIEDNVQIGALTVIAKGAIDDTVIHSGCRIDNSCFISHNVELGEDSVIVGETIMFGSSSTGRQAFISGNSTIRDGIHIGEMAFVGMAANVLKAVPDGGVVKGNPAK
jgi:UDP-3-O-[3-hydroxymyristoyl] glucosamine N-acyltransferase